MFGPRAHILRRYITKSSELLATALTIAAVRMWVALLVRTLTLECKGSEYRPFNDVYLPTIIRVTKTRIVRWAGHVACMRERKGAYWVLEGKPEGKRPLGRPRHRWEDNIKIDLQELRWRHGLD